MAFEYQAEARWKQNVAVLGSFAPIDENFAGIEVDIPDLDVDEFVHAYNGIEEQFEQDLVLHIAALLDGSEEPFQIGVGEQLPEGLRTSQVVLALLSPRSVRRALDAGNPTATDSVCLDEIAYARGVRKIPIVPVQVVSCEAPFLVYRLHQIDFRRWRESEATYQAGLNQICAGIEAALRGETPDRPWRPLLEPWDFAPFLLEKRNHFTGRQWLFRYLDEWRSKETPPALLITGEPGIGKSAIVAALVDNNPEGQVLAYHCCRADTPATVEPARFADDIQRLDACELRERNDVLPHGRVGGSLTDPVAGHQGNVSVQQEIGGSRANSDHRELQGICFVAHRHDVAHRDDNLVCPRALLVGRKNQDSLTLQSNINLRARLGDSANALRTYREWEGRSDAIDARDEHKVRWIERGRFHRDENFLLAKSRFGDRVEFNDICGFAVSYELQPPHKKPPFIRNLVFPEIWVRSTCRMRFILI